MSANARMENAQQRTLQRGKQARGITDVDPFEVPHLR